MTYYETLGIDENATQEQIKTAYRTLVKKYHPDVNDAPNAAAFFRLIQEAYETLGNPALREEYNRSLLGAPSANVETESPQNSQRDEAPDTYNYTVYPQPVSNYPPRIERSFPAGDSIITLIVATVCFYNIVHVHLAISILFALGITALLAFIFHTRVGWWIVSIVYSLFWSTMAGGIAYSFSKNDWIWFWSVFGVVFLISMGEHKFKLDT